MPHSVRPLGVPSVAERSAPGSATSSLAARAAVGAEQSARARTSLWTALWLSMLAAAALQLTRNKSPVHWILTGTIITLAIACGAVLLEARDGRAIKQRRMLLTGVMTVLVVLAATAHLGVLTPMVSFLMVTVYYNSSGDFRHERVIYVLSAVGYGALAVLSFVGVLPLTESVLALVEQNDRALLGFAAVGEGLLFATYRMAKANRVATLEAIESLERARRQVEQRDALLFEARADLDGANRAGGRHTGSRVGPYLVGEIIGRGATGEVYEAVDGETAEPAALKILFPHLLEDRVLVARLIREAELTRQLQSPHVPRLIGGGETVDGCPYLATELLVGEDLSQYLRAHRTMDPKSVVEMVSQVARALNVAQEKGIVHRDLKPQNIYLTRERDGGRAWKVLDFGAAALVEGASDLTRGAAVGTPSYMSPEQTRGEAVDHRSDVFALGAIVYRALTGQPPFAAADAMSTMFRVNHVQPVKPSLLAKLHEDVDLVLALALAKKREQRLRSAATFAAALRDACRGELDPAFRASARDLLGQHGWMQEVA